jgi:pilus assembly protein CpaB
VGENMRSRNILILALAMALITTVLFNQYLKNLDKKYKKSQNKVSVIAAKADIKKNQRVNVDMLEVKEVDSDSVYAESIKKIEELEGKYALTDIKKGEILLPFRFTDRFKENQLLTRKVREGFRAVSVEVNFVESVSNLIQPEDYVDVVFSEEIKRSGANSVINTVFILENVRVLAVGKRLSENELQSSDTKDATTNETEYVSVTLELNPSDSVKLINADERGKIKLILRSKISR